MPILWPDLTCQMLAQRVLAVRPKIIVEIPEPRFQRLHAHPDLGGSGAQLLCRALPGRMISARTAALLTLSGALP